VSGVGDIESGFDDSPGPVESLRYKIVMIAVGVITLAVFFIVFFSAFNTLRHLFAIMGQ